MMDCVEAQRLISERLDKAPVDETALEVAKDHCRTCPECGVFVRAMLDVNSAALPEPPADLVDRILARIQAEAQTASGTGLGDGLPSLESVAPSSEDTDALLAGTPWARLARAFNDPRNYRTVVTWTAVAAVLFVAGGIGTIAGVRQILAPSTGADMLVTESAPTAGESRAFDGAATQSTPEASAPADAAQPAASTPAAGYITVSSTVYRAAGPVSGIDATTLKPAGTTVTALDSDAGPATRQLSSLDDPGRLYLPDGAGGYLAFDRVTRSFGGMLYALQSGSLERYGQWPTLPATVSRPRESDGSPYYSLLGIDASGIEVFGASGSAANGIMVGPGTPPGDSAGGNPDWTWWAPIR